MRAFLVFVIVHATPASAHRKVIAVTKSMMVDQSEENATFNKLVDTSAPSMDTENATLTECVFNGYEEPKKYKYCFPSASTCSESATIQDIVGETLNKNEQILAIVYGPMFTSVGAVMTYDTTSKLVLTHWVAHKATKSWAKTVFSNIYCGGCPSCNLGLTGCYVDKRRQYNEEELVQVSGHEATLTKTDEVFKLKVGSRHLSHIYVVSKSCFQCRDDAGNPFDCSTGA